MPVNSIQAGSLELSFPTEKGLTITPNAPGITFSPAQFDVPAGGSTFTFTYQPTLLSLQETPVQWTLSGLDAAKYSVPLQKAVGAGQSMFFVIIEINSDDISVAVNVIDSYSDWNGQALRVGDASNAFVVTLDAAPVKQLIVTPHGAGLTFNPPALNFGPGVTRYINLLY